MPGIQASQPGGAGTLTADGTIVPGVRVYLTFTGTSATLTWTLNSKPGGSNATPRLHPRLGWYIDPEVANGTYAVQFTDASSNKYFINLSTTQVRAVAAPAERIGLDVSNLVSGDVNTVIPSDMTLPECVSSECVLTPSNASTQGFRDGTLVVGTSGTGTCSWLYCAVSSTMSFTIAMSEASSKAVKMSFVDTDLSTVMTSTRPTLNPTEQVYTLTQTGLTVGSLYKVKLETSDLGQGATPVVGRVALSPVNGSGIWADNFVRFRANATMLGDTSVRSTFVAGQYMQHNGFAEVRMHTDAPSVTAEVWTDNAGLSGKIASLVDGRDYQVGATLTTGKPSMDTHNFSDAGGILRAIALRTDGHDNASGALTANPKGCFFRAVYVKQAANVIFRPAVGTRRLYIWGTSIERGVGATEPLFGGWVHRMRRRYPGAVVVDAYSGRAFKTDADTAAKRNALAAWIAQYNPTDVYMALGPNDYVAAAWSAAAYGVAYAAFLDAMHAVCPGARIYTETQIIHTAGSGEGANGLGDTMPTFRTELTNAANNASRVPWSILVDGFTTNPLAPIAGDLADGTHPNDIGHGKKGAVACGGMASAGAL